MSGELNPSFGTARILRPFEGFEAIYQGQSSFVPIMFSLLGKATDPLAGDEGYSSKLLRGMPVPIGTRLDIWLPNINATDLFGPVLEGYNFEFTWRFRNAHDYRKDVAPYHLAKQTGGAPDTTGGGNLPRVIIPAAYHSVVYNEAEPSAVRGNAVNNLRIEDISPRGGGTLLPFLPDGTSGIFQQGLLDPGIFSTVASIPTFNVYDIMAFGDEILVGVYRDFATLGPWDFTFATGVDFLFSALFGNGSGTAYPNLGIYISPGVAP